MFESQGIITTSHGIKWELITLNGRTAFQREPLTILWMDKEERYVLLDGLAQVVRRGSLQDCLDSVRYDVN